MISKIFAILIIGFLLFFIYCCLTISSRFNDYEYIEEDEKEEK